jgi:hypothetical protein
MIFFPRDATAQLGAQTSSLLMFLDDIHTHTHIRTPLNQGPARRRGRYLHNRQQPQETNIRTPSGIRNRDPSNQAVADTLHRTLLLFCWMRPQVP